MPIPFQSNNSLCLELLFHDFQELIIALHKRINLKLEELIPQFFQNSLSKGTLEINLFLLLVFILNVMHLVVDFDDCVVVHQDIDDEEMD